MKGLDDVMLDVQVSIIIPVYNTESLISECIDSILNQSFINWELILVDDGSTDDSRRICELYAQNDHRIKVLMQENQGQGAARNYGLKHIKGKYVMFVDSDDIIHKNILKDLLSAIIEENADIAMANIQKFFHKDEIRCEGSISKGKVYNCDFYDKFVCENNWTNHVIVSKLYNKELLEGVKFPEYRAIEDEFFLSKIYSKVTSIVYLNEIRYYYRQTNISTMRGGFNANRSLIVKALLERALICENMKKYKLAVIVKGQCLLECMSWWSTFSQKKIEKKANEMMSIFDTIYSDGMKSPCLTNKDRIRIFIFRRSPVIYKFILTAIRR